MSASGALCVGPISLRSFSTSLRHRSAAVHLAGAVDEIVRFIDQKDIAALFLEKPPQIDGWVKDIIIVADDQ